VSSGERFFVNTNDAEPIPNSKLTLDRFRASPVWTWYDGPKDDAQDWFVPVPLTEDGISSAHKLFIHSRFVTRSGAACEGCIIFGLYSGEVYAVKIWCNGVWVTFNMRLKSRAEAPARRLADVLGIQPSEIFPPTYSVVSPELTIPEGEFDFVSSG